MIKKANTFLSENKRTDIQDLVDQQVFSDNAPEETILNYLENPYLNINKKYEQLY